MASMFRPASSAWVAMPASKAKRRTIVRRFTFLRYALHRVVVAVARRDALLLRVLRGIRLDLVAHELAVGLHPVGDDLPLGAIPLLELDQSRALVVQAGDLERRHEADRAQLLQALRSEEHTSELQSQSNLVCRLLLEKK